MNTISSFLIVSLAGLFMLAGCGPGPESDTIAKEIFARLNGKSWKLEHWTDASGASQEVGPITLAVGDDCRISGNASVNRYMGRVKFNADGSLDLSSGFATTMMMGPPDAMARETRYLAALSKVHQALLQKDRLVLTGEGSLRLEFLLLDK